MASATISGLSTLGVTFSYAVETTAGTKPAAFTLLNRCNSISGIELDTETIDSSALEDMQSRYVAGRQDTGGDWTVTFNLTPETITELTTMMSAAAAGLAETTPKRTWFQVTHPDMENAFFVVGQPGSSIPMPDIGQNELLTGDISIAIEEYKGLSTKVTAS